LAPVCCAGDDLTNSSANAPSVDILPYLEKPSKGARAFRDARYRHAFPLAPATRKRRGPPTRDRSSPSSSFSPFVHLSTWVHQAGRAA
jgi:hypothetical protein